MKIKISELKGAALDWAVAKCEGYPVVNNPEQGDWKQTGWWQCGPHAWQPLNAYSTNWAQGGPIIEREEIGTEEIQGAWKAELEHLTTDDAGYRYGLGYGPTPLIAAMRCYVASKLGEEVEVPEGLIVKE